MSQTPPEHTNVLLQLISQGATGAWNDTLFTAEEMRKQIKEATETDEHLSQFDVQVVQVDDEVCVQLIAKSAVDQLAKLAVEPEQ